MKATKKMSWDTILKKLKVGISLADRETKAQSNPRRFHSAIDKIAFSSAKSTHQLDGFGEAGIVEQLQTGALFPDEMFGWSTKTILVILLGLCLLKLKKAKGT